VCRECTSELSDEIFCMGRDADPPRQSRTFGTGKNGGFASHLMVPRGQCSDLLYNVPRSHRWKVHRNHRNGVPWHPLS
jgi:hypothetical protein